ncbi:MAG: hypothetical protein GY821_09780 [Gammaproteobacteria bacterium]|nr:hypothetical protein [Gammaproteobacteria bacterium]
MEVKAGIFLVDSWCLGIKDCFTCNIDTHKIAEKFSQPDNQLQKIPPSSAKAFIMQASHYAKNLGFNPMGDFDKCWKLFHDVKTDGDHPLLTFGKDGKPFYIAGPHDDGNFQRKVMATLNKSVGPDNYHFVLPVQP